MRRLAFLFHLYQPVTQDEKTFREVANSCYLPLMKTIKNRRNIKVTLNIPLSLSEQMDKYGYSEWLGTVKELVSSEVIELTGSAAYHPLLTKIPGEVVENQIILNEYGLGYYLGRTSGFEGEKAIMIRGLRGFFPPELAVSMDVLKVVEELGYQWVVVDKYAVEDSNNDYGVYKMDDDFCVVVRDKDLSNILSFKRTADVSDFVNLFAERANGVVALDGEVFGHHYSEGIYMFGRLLDGLDKLNVEYVTASDYVEWCTSESLTGEATSIVESTWGMSSNKDAVYPFWDQKENNAQGGLWRIFNAFIENYDKMLHSDDQIDDAENRPIWKEHISDSLDAEVLFNKVLNSDQFWWASGATVGGKYLLDKGMVIRSLELYKKLGALVGADELLELVNKEEKIVLPELEKHEDTKHSTLLSAS